MITPTLGVREEDDTVYYLHSGMPIYSHGVNELNKFRYITSNLLLQGLCKNIDIVGAFHVSTDSVRRWKKRLSEEGEEAFFKPENRHGRRWSASNGTPAPAAARSSCSFAAPSPRAAPTPPPAAPAPCGGGF